MADYAIVASAAGTYFGVEAVVGQVVNTIVWDGVEPFQPPNGTTSILIPEGSIVSVGYSYADGAFTPPAPPPAPPQTLAQQAAALIAGGITITSAGTPALNGTYSTNAAAQQNAANVMGYINQNQKLPGSNPNGLSWYTAEGAQVFFPTIAEFTAFYNVGMSFVFDCQDIIYSNSGTLPPTEYTIP